MDRPPGIVCHRVPRVLAELVNFEYPLPERVLQHAGVRPVLRAERAGVDAAEPGCPALDGPSLSVERGLREIGQMRVEPVVAECGGRVRVTPRPVVEVLRG